MKHLHHHHRHRPRWSALWAASLGCALSTSGCTLSGEPIVGHVIDESTGQPVRDAIVYVHWYGTLSGLHSSRPICFHVETARSDASGRYETGRWSLPLSIRNLAISHYATDYGVYKPGHIPGQDVTTAPRTMSMTPYKGSAEWYFDHVLGRLGTACAEGGESRKNEYRLLMAMAAEADAMATSNKQRGIAAGLRNVAQSALVNDEKPTEYRNGVFQNVNPRDGFRKEEVPQ